MTVANDFWTIAPAANGYLYSGTIPAPVWAAIPNYLNENASVSVNIKTTYITSPAGGAGTTVALVGSLPTGWAFNGTTLTYNGTSVNAVPTTGLYFNATYLGLTTPSGTFSVQGVGSPSGDTTAPIIPVGMGVTANTSSSVTIGGFTPSDPSPSGHTWSGLQQINVTRSPGGLLGHTTIGPGNQPNWTFGDVGVQTSVVTQTGADLAVTTTAHDATYPTTSALGGAYQQITGTSWVISCKISAFVAANAYDNIRLEARTSNATNSAYVAVLCQPFAGGIGFSSEYRAGTGTNATTLQTVSNSTSPAWLFLVRSGDIYSFYYSIDGNTLSPLSTATQVMGSTIYVWAGINTQDGVSIGPIAIQQVSLQTLGNWSYTDSTVSSSTSYTYTATSQDVASNISNASTALAVVTPGGTNVKWPTGHYMGSYEVDRDGGQTPAKRIEQSVCVGSGANVLGWMGSYTHATIDHGEITASIAGNGVMTLTSVNSVQGGLQLGNQLGYAGFTAVISINVLLSGSLGAPGSTYSTSGSPGALSSRTFYVYDFSHIDGDIAALSGKKIHIRVGVGYYGSTQPVPNYIIIDSKYGPSPVGGQYGYWDLNQGQTGFTGAIWRQAYMTKWIAMFQALGYYYDGNALVVSIGSQDESAQAANLTAGSDYNEATQQSLWAQLEVGAVAAMPHTNFCMQCNYNNGGIQQSANMMATMYANRTAFDGPDIYGLSVSLPYTPGGFYDVWGIDIFMNIASTTPNFDYRGKMACIHEIQAPELVGAWATTPQDIFNMADQQIHANMLIWNYISGTGQGSWSGQVLPVINANPITHTAYPTGYP